MQNKISKIRVVMERNKCLRKISMFMKRIGLIAVIHSFMRIVDRKKKKKEIEFTDYYNSFCNEFDNVISILEDSLSIETYSAVIEYKMGNNYKKLNKYMCFPQYFVPNIYSLEENSVFINGGAYIGDTIDDFLKFTKNKYKKIYAWEPDNTNIIQLQKKQRNEKIEIVPKGMWNEKTTLHFSATADGCSTIANMGEILIEVDSIDNMYYEKKSEKISLIVMDIEGSEQRALEGARKIILRDKPVLAISIYHSFEDLYKIPLWIKSLENDYKIFIRAHADNSSEVVVYAVQ